MWIPRIMILNPEIVLTFEKFTFHPSSYKLDQNGFRRPEGKKIPLTSIKMMIIFSQDLVHVHIDLVFGGMGGSIWIDQFWYIKIQPQTIDLSTRLWGINTEFVGFIPQSLVLKSIVWDWFLIYRNWSIFASFWLPVHSLVAAGNSVFVSTWCCTFFSISPAAITSQVVCVSFETKESLT